MSFSQRVSNDLETGANSVICCAFSSAKQLLFGTKVQKI